MKKTGLFISIALFTVMIISCKKEKTQPGNQPNTNNEPPAQVKGIQPFSGMWKGTISVDDLGICYYDGTPITTSQEWVVNPDSSITITETNLDYNSSVPWTQTWKGRLYNKDSLAITLTKDIRCFGVTQPMTTQVKIKIAKAADGKYTIAAGVDYPMCPPDCLFTFNYSVKKQE